MKRNKRITALLVAVCMLLLSIPAVAANENITVYLDDILLSFDVPPQIIDGRTMVPMRKIFEVLGAEVQWEGETRSIKATTDELEIGLKIDKNIVLKIIKDTIELLK